MRLHLLLTPLLTPLLTALPLAAQVDHRPPAADNPGMVLTKFRFGSCCKQDKPQPLWEAVVQGSEKSSSPRFRRPQLFLWLGDNIYADTEDMAAMKAKYAQLAANEGYQKLVATCPVIATWDDHDYGANDAGREYPKKAESKEVFLDFFNEPADSPRRQREGIYTSYLFGPEGKRVQIILLDMRTFRSPLKKGPRAPYPRMGRYLPDKDPAATMLGEEQWKWLEAELRKPADLRFLGCGTQIVCEHDGFEAWSNMPREQERFLKLVKDTKAEGLILLAGDSHHGELHLGEYEGLYQLWEITSSGINQGLPATEDQTRVGPAVPVANSGTVLIDWDAQEVTLSVGGLDPKEGLSQIVPINQLNFDPKNLTRSSRITDAAGTWKTRWGPLILERGEEGEWSGTYPNGGSLSLKEEGEALTGRWKKGRLFGKCRFTMSRHGRYLRGVSGIEEKPMLMNWCGW